MDIVEQKQIASILLRKLEVLDLWCIVAGGAPRNWLGGQLARDLDIYIHFRPAGVQQAIDLVKVLTEVDTELNGKTYEDNKGLISYVLDGEYSGIKCQFIFINEKVGSTTDHFIVDNSKLYYKHGHIRQTPRCHLSHFMKEIWVNKEEEQLTPQQVKYINKIAGYYPDWPIVFTPDVQAARNLYVQSFTEA